LRISIQHKFIYFSQPKTASAAVRDFLDPISDVEVRVFTTRSDEHPFYSHMRPVETRAIFEQKGWCFDQAYRFMTVRNPWARLASLYKMARRARLPSLENKGFAQFIHSIDPIKIRNPATDQKWWDHGSLSVGAFSAGPDGRSLVINFFKIEDGLHDMIDALRVRGVPAEQAVRVINNARTPYDYRDMYDDRSKRHIAKLYEEEVDRFRYSFG
jgi:hypothetical protein